MTGRFAMIARPTEGPDSPETPLSNVSRQWIERAQAGGGASVWDPLWHRYHARLLIYADLQLGPALRTRCSAEDLVQEAWVRVLGSFDSFVYRRRESLLSWLFLNVKRSAQEWGRKASGSREHSTSLGDEDEVVLDLPAASPGPRASVSSAETLESITRSLEDVRIRPFYRDLLVGYYIEGRTREELAAERETNLETLRKQLNRALTKWREVLGDDPLRWLF